MNTAHYLRRGHRNYRRGSASTILPIVILTIIAALALVWAMRPGPEVEANRKMQAEILGKMTGLHRPVENKLDPRYTDADKNLLADTPADASKLLDPPSIVFGYIAQEDAARMATVFAPLMEHISKAIGKPVTYAPLTDVDAQLRAMRDGQLHVTAFNTGAVPIAVDAAGFIPISTLGGDAGKSTYRLKILASTKSSVTDVSNLPKPSDKIDDYLVFTEPSSNSGYKAPLVLLKKLGLEPGRDYAWRYSGGHVPSILGLAEGDYKYVAVASDVLERELKAGDVKSDQYRILYESDPFPAACFGVPHNLKPDLAAKIREAINSFVFAGNSVGNYFEASGQTRLVPIDFAADFAIVRDIDNQIGYEHALRDQPPVETTTDPAALEPAPAEPATQPATN